MRRTIAAAFVATATLLGACSSPNDHPMLAHTDRAEQAIEQARAFLADYVDPDGRVVRRDQGGDTVSEGQAYAMLLAIAADDRTRFDTVWRWAQQNLQQASGLFAFHWAQGRVQDTMPSADADVLIAWALGLASEHFGDDQMLNEARRTADSVLTHEVVRAGQGEALVAGPWAKERPSAVVEPGYWAASAEQSLASLTGEPRWSALSATHARLVGSLTNDGARLPADWVSLEGEQPTATSAPSGSPGPQSGQDGLRLMVWAACSDATRGLAARWWQLIATTADAAPLARTLQGAPLQNDRSPLSAVSAAAVAGAAGDTARRETLLDTASSIAEQYPTYYGSAWAALGRVLLETDRLTDCG